MCVSGIVTHARRVNIAKSDSRDRRSVAFVVPVMRFSSRSQGAVRLRFERRLAQAAFVAVAGLAVASCSGESPPPAGPLRSEYDSLARLDRALLHAQTTDAAKRVTAAIMCEQARFNETFGLDSGQKIINHIEDSVYSWRDWAAQRRVGGLMGGTVLPLTAPTSSVTRTPRQSGANTHRPSRVSLSPNSWSVSGSNR